MKEVWKDIVGYEGLYQISNLGKVRSFYRNGKIMKATENSRGYLRVTLNNNGQKRLFIHRLVAEHFRL